MKHLVTFIIATMCFCGSAFADVTLVFVAGSDVCTPITVSVQGRTYKVYDVLSVDGFSGSITVRATDCNGRNLTYKYGSESGTQGGRSYSISTYTFHSTDSYGSDSPGYGSGSGGYNQGRDYSSAKRAGEALGHALFSLGGGGEGDAYPSMQLLLGGSRAYGEYARLRYTGYGFHAYAGVGKDWLLDSEFKNKILWNVGLGSYFAFGGDGNPNMDVAVGLSVGQIAQYEKLSLMIDADYTYWIGRWRRVGIMAGGSLGWGSFTEMFNTDDYDSQGGFAWNLEVGVVFRLANF